MGIRLHQWCFVRKCVAGQWRPLYYQCFRCGLVQHEESYDQYCFVLGDLPDPYRWEDTDILEVT
jgi:hypothetical protein